MKHRFGRFLFLIITFTGAVLIWILVTTKSDPMPIFKHTQENKESDTQPVSNDGEFPDEQISSLDDPHARRIVHIPDIPKDPNPPSQSIDLKFRATVEEKINSALAGNLEDVISIVQYVNQCDNIPLNETALNRKLELYSRVPGVSLNINDGIGVSWDVESFAEYEEVEWLRFSQCISVRDLFSKNLHDQILTQAENGHVVARYIYAIWPPPPSSTDPNALLERLEYMTNALAFTWSNVEEGESLGLLAFGQSFLSTRFFTPHRKHYGQAFVLATKSCGLQTSWADSVIGNIRSNAIERVQMSASEIEEAFCY